MSRPVRSRDGFTLAELLIVTVLLGLLATLVAPSVQRFREKALNAAARADLRNAITGIELYRTLDYEMPSSHQDLINSDVGYVLSEGIEYCYFIALQGGFWGEPSVLLVVAHEASRTRLVTRHPTWDGRITEWTVASPGC